MRLNAVWFAVLALSIGASVAASQTIDPASAIAQKFSEASEPKPAAKPDRPSLDYEMDMLRRARSEELDREQQEKKTAAPPKVAEPASVPSPVAPTHASPSVVPTKLEPKIPAPVVTQPAAAVPEKPVAVQNVAAPDAPLTIAPKADGLGLTDLPDTMFGAMPRATLLLVLSADGSTSTTKPDPIICLEDRCWLSNGYEAPARPLLRSQAVALKSSAGATSDPCAGKSACVYRNVALRPDTQIQVVELGDGLGTSDGAYTIDVDATCRKHGGELLCDNGLVTREFRLWVIPEQTAQTIGANLLEDAIVAGLPKGENDASRDK